MISSRFFGRGVKYSTQLRQAGFDLRQPKEKRDRRSAAPGLRLRQSLGCVRSSLTVTLPVARKADQRKVADGRAKPRERRCQFERPEVASPRRLSRDDQHVVARKRRRVLRRRWWWVAAASSGARTRQYSGMDGDTRVRMPRGARWFRSVPLEWLFGELQLKDVLEHALVIPAAEDV